MSLPIVLAVPCTGQVTERANVGWNGSQANGQVSGSQSGRFLSDDGRFVVFASGGSNLVPGDTNVSSDIFVRDRLLGVNERVSVDSAGLQANNNSGTYGFSMTSDGRFVAFNSSASNLVIGDSNGVADVFLRDRALGITERVSVSSLAGQGNGMSEFPSVSAGGRFVAYQSAASNLDPYDTNGCVDIFLRDRLLGSTERVSVSSTGVDGNGDSQAPAISADGRYVAFYSIASNLVPGDNNAKLDVFVRDRQSHSTSMVSLSSTGVSGNGHSSWPSISDSGRFVVFTSEASTLVPGDVNGFWDVFVRDLRLGTTECVSTSSNGAPANGSCFGSSISADGRFIAFASGATNLVPAVTSGGIFVSDRTAGTLAFTSTGTNGGMPNGTSQFPSVSTSGRYVVFTSIASNLVQGDTNVVEDTFLRDRQASGFETLCLPASDGVSACPCNNGTASLDRGCDNSAGTGGALLTASGIAYLSQDSLTFTTVGELPSATTVLVQGDALIPAGVVFGQGVRCVGGALRRLYVKTAISGSITAPDTAAGDPSVSARSATLGTALQPGVAYYYFAFYRDPLVLGGCPATSTFNATQAGRVSWWP